MDTTVIIALITALAAIISPIITALINNKHNYKMKLVEKKQERIRNIDLHERDILEKALASVGIFIGMSSAGSVTEACSSILAAVAYVDTQTGELIRKAVYALVHGVEETSLEEYSAICEVLKQEIAKRTND